MLVEERLQQDVNKHKQNIHTWFETEIKAQNLKLTAEVVRLEAWRQGVPRSVDDIPGILAKATLILRNTKEGGGPLDIMNALEPRLAKLPVNVETAVTDWGLDPKSAKPDAEMRAANKLIGKVRALGCEKDFLTVLQLYEDGKCTQFSRRTNLGAKWEVWKQKGVKRTAVFDDYASVPVPGVWPWPAAPRAEEGRAPGARMRPGPRPGRGCLETDAAHAVG